MLRGKKRLVKKEYDEVDKVTKVNKGRIKNYD